METLCKKPSDSYEEPEPQKNLMPNNVKEGFPHDGNKIFRGITGIYPTLKRLVNAPSAPPLPPYPATSHHQHHPRGLYPPPQLIPGGDRTHIPFRLSELKELKNDLGSYTKNLDQYIQAFREVSQNFELSWKDMMLLLSQTLTSLEKQQVLDQAVGPGENYHLAKCGPIGLSQTKPWKRRRGRGKKDRDTGYPKGNPKSQFPQEIRQCLDRILSGTLRMTRMNGPVSTSSTAFLRV
jgi:hypothetical protein